MFLVRQILPATIIAMMAAAGVCSLAFCFGRERVRSLLIPLAVGSGYVAGHLFVVGLISFPPSDTTNWLPFFAVDVAILGAFWILPRVKLWLGAVIFALVSGVALRLLLRPKFQYGWSLLEGWAWLAGLTMAFVLLAILLDAFVRRPVMAIEVPAVLLIICAGTFVALMVSGSMLLGQFAAILGASVFGTLVLAVRPPGMSRGIVPVFSLLLGALLVSGYFFASLPGPSALLLAFAFVPALGPAKLTGRFQELAVRVALVLIPVAIALTMAFRSSPPLEY